MTRTLEPVPVNREGGEPLSRQSDWVDPGYFSNRSRVMDWLKIFWNLFKPPKGHRTLPTKTGFMLILVSLGVGTAAFNTAHNILYIALALLLSSLLLSGLLSWMNFKGCRWRLQSIDCARVGDYTPIKVDLANTKTFLPTYALRFELHADLAHEDHVLAQHKRLGPGSDTSLEWAWIPQKRGVTTIHLRRLVSLYPFGFLRKTIEDSAELEVVVWPKRMDYTLLVPQSRLRSMMGSVAATTPGGMELKKLRSYRAGDPLRQVHWKASARQRKLVVRETVEERLPQFRMNVETAYYPWSSDEQAVELLASFAASLAEDFFKQGQLAAVAVNGALITPVERWRDFHEVLDQLARLQPLSKPLGQAEQSSLERGWMTFSKGSGTKLFCHLDGNLIGQT